MRIQLIAVGTKMPAWITAGYQEYAQRLHGDCRLQLIEIEAGKRTKHADIARILQQEGQQMLTAIAPQHHVIALDVRGQSWSTLELAQQLQKWQLASQSISFLVGGPEGLAPACLARAQSRLSLSALTLPHPLVRVVLAEQLYRAWSFAKGHPYHRA